MYDILMQYVRPELVVLVVILYCIGIALKNTKTIADEMIPFILGVLSILITALYIVAVSDTPKGYQEVLSIIFNILVQGICAAAAAVYFNQSIKQAKKFQATEGESGNGSN